MIDNRTETDRERQTDKQTDRQIFRQTNRQKRRQTDRHTGDKGQEGRVKRDRQIDRQPEVDSESVR